MKLAATAATVSGALSTAALNPCCVRVKLSGVFSCICAERFAISFRLFSTLSAGERTFLTAGTASATLPNVSVPKEFLPNRGIFDSYIRTNTFKGISKPSFVRIFF